MTAHTLIGKIVKTVRVPFLEGEIDVFSEFDLSDLGIKHDGNITSTELQETPAFGAPLC